MTGREMAIASMRRELALAGLTERTRGSAEKGTQIVRTPADNMRAELRKAGLEPIR